MTRQWVTVFGGTGFLGRHIVRELLDAGMGVRIASRHPRVPPGIEDNSDQIQLHTANLHDSEATQQAISGAHAVVNAISLYVEKGGNETFKQVHEVGAERIARQALDKGVERLVHISGVGVDANSDSAYVRARALGDAKVRESFPNATVLRPCVMFGPDDALLASISKATLSPVVPLFGRGQTRLQPVFVEDVAKAVRTVLHQPETAGEIYELGGPDVLTYRALVRRVIAHLNRYSLLLPMPFPLWRMLAVPMRFLPTPPLTRDQVILMEKDNRVGEDAKSFHDLRIEPRSIGSLLKECLGT